jgi:hypothetical protein
MKAQIGKEWHVSFKEGMCLAEMVLYFPIVSILHLGERVPAWHQALR